jgi:hypothetical protein
MRRFVAAMLAATFVLIMPTMVLAEEVTAKPAEATEVTAFTFDEACCALKTLPAGEHKITFIHPYTCCPVEVCFCLPCGCYELICKDGCIGAKRLVFKYPGLCKKVVIKFKKDGTVVVD